MATTGNNPSLVAKALAKALSVETRLNSLIGTGQDPQQPTVVYDPGTAGGQVIVTQSSNGTFTWTCPAGVTQAMVECWAAGAGAGGGTGSAGGEGGGGGEYAQEPGMTVVPGTVYSYTVGNGGTGGPSGTAGTSGGDSFFNFGGTGTVVYANGGDAGGSLIGGTGGTGSTNTIHNNGGKGGGDGSQSTGGCGGGGSGGSTGAGGSGTDSGSSTGSAGGAAGAGGGAVGGHGGNSGANGSNGAGVGAAGGGSGTGSTTVITKTYNANTCRSYYGADAGSNANKTRQVNGTVWQGGETATGGSSNGTQKFVLTFPTSPTIVSDFSGATMTSATFGINNQHSWYGSGMSVQIRLWQSSGGLPPTWDGLGAPLIFDSTIGENVGKSWSIGQSIAAGFAAGTNFGIAFGPGPNAFDVNWYGYFYGAGSAHPPTLKLVGTVGTVVAAGNGVDGQVKITYTTPPSTNVIAAVQPIATTDAAGNALAAGVTVNPSGAGGGGSSTVTAIQPGSSPSVIEVWHLATPGTGSNQAGDIRLQYRITADNMVQIVGTITNGSSMTGGTLFTLPVGYRSSTTTFIPCAFFPVADGSAYLTINSSGIVTINCPAVAATNTLIINGQFPLGIT